MFGTRKPKERNAPPRPAPPVQHGMCTARCGRPATHVCLYTDRRRQQCLSAWCDEHAASVGDGVYCRRHAGIMRAMSRAEDHDLELPDLDNRAPSLCEWLANDLDGGVQALLILTQLVHPGSSISARQLHRTIVGMPRRSVWLRSWMLQDHTGPRLRVSVEVDEKKDDEVVVRVDSIEVERFVPPWIAERGASDPGLMSQKRQYVRARILQAVATKAGDRNTVGQIGEVMQKLASTEERAQEAAERSRAVLENVADGILTMDANGIIESTNPSARRILGYSDRELIGQPISLILGEGAHNEMVSTLQRRSWLEPDPEHAQAREWQGRRRDGSVFQMEFMVTDLQLGARHLFVGTFRDISERKAHHEAIAHQAMHDALTELPNRNLLNDRLRMRLEECRRTGQLTGVMLMDLDRFKEVNDALGHRAGDVLLQEIASRLRSVLRDSDTVARLGGDEFAILPGGVTGAESVLDTARRILATFDAPVMLEGTMVEVEASIGVAMFPEHGMAADELMQHADTAMYAAKRLRSGCALYSPDRDEHSASRLGLVAELRKGIPGGELRLRYQPKVNMASGKLVSVEALVRWEHPRLGLLSPDAFLAAAEDSGLIKPLTEWVIDEALRQHRAWADAGLDIGVAVNLSARSLKHDLAKTVKRLMDWHGVAPQRLTLEITETFAMAPSANHLLSELRDMGCRLSIDDFGTGYSSLAYLRGLPIAEMKIDRSFIKDLATSTDDAAIVRSTIELAHSLGLEVVAEGVADVDGRGLLLDYSCDYAQSYFLSPPLAPEDVEGWVPGDVWQQHRPFVVKKKQAG